jgi:hypothetical protein
MPPAISATNAHSVARGRTVVTIVGSTHWAVTFACPLTPRRAFGRDLYFMRLSLIEKSDHTTLMMRQSWDQHLN